jgi:5-methylthioribose kinase
MTDSKPILEAIAAKRFLEITYNRMRMKIAPHVLYARHGDLFLDAVPVERDGKSLIDPRLATFKLAGLEIIQIMTTSFVPFPGFDPSDAKYAETMPPSAE